ncbi:MAG: ATP-binding protein [Bdellovibrionales bacterium]
MDKDKNLARGSLIVALAAIFIDWQFWLLAGEWYQRIDWSSESTTGIALVLVTVVFALTDSAKSGRGLLVANLFTALTAFFLGAVSSGLVKLTLPEDSFLNIASKSLTSTSEGCAGLLLLAILSDRLKLTLWRRLPVSFFLALLVFPKLLMASIFGIFRFDTLGSGPSIFEMAPVSIVVLVALWVRIVFRQPLQWPLTALTGNETRARILRWQMLAAAVIPVGFGFLFHELSLSGVFSEPMTLGFLLAFIIAAFWVMILWAGVWTYRIQKERELMLRRLEDSWKDREAYFRTLVEDSPVILYLSDSEGRCTFLGKKWQEYTGRQTAHDLGFGWMEALHPVDKEKMNHAHSIGVKNNEAYSVEYRLRRADGAYRWVISSGFPRFDDNQKFVGYMGNVIDVHERKTQIDALIRDKESAEMASQAKSQFLANMSHEIRTPLNSILGFAELGGDPGVSKKDLNDYLSRIRNNGEHLLRIIDDILDISKMESGALLLRKSHVAIRTLVQETVASMRPLAQQKQLALNIDFADGVKEIAYTDPLRVKQVLNNLVGNAIKFTAKGEINIVVEPLHDSLSITIKDTGEGVAPSVQDQLFRPFSQADGSVTRRHGGTGLGLHLSRKLATMLGGNVELVESASGKGSVFRFVFEIGEDQPTVETPDSASPVSIAPATNVKGKFKGKKILVAEDSPDARDLVDLFFYGTGAEVEFAENGLDVVRAALKNEPDLVLMDVQMPEMDGLAATRHLRGKGFQRPIVALTAHALQDEVDRSFEAGCNYHLTKPISRTNLIELVDELLNRPGYSA